MGVKLFARSFRSFRLIRRTDDKVLSNGVPGIGMKTGIIYASRVTTVFSDGRTHVRS